MIVHAAIIEYDSGETPSLHLSTDPLRVMYAAALEVWEPDADTDDLEDFYRDFPARPVADLDLLEIWHEAYREATTVPWITFEVQEVH